MEKNATILSEIPDEGQSTHKKAIKVRSGNFAETVVMLVFFPFTIKERFLVTSFRILGTFNNFWLVASVSGDSPKALTLFYDKCTNFVVLNFS